MKETLIKQEQDLAEESFSTANNFEHTSKIIDFPRQVAGLTIIDIGGGASTCVAELRERGANAISVDYRYYDRKKLKRSVDRKLADVPAILNERVDQVRTNLRAFFTEDLEVRGQQQFVRHSRKYRDRFFYNLESGHGQYITALAGFLPIRSDSVDFVYSAQAVSTFLLKEMGVFQNAMDEIFRILKAGGEVQIQPWISDLFHWSNKEKENAHVFLQHLENSSISYQIEQLPGLRGPRLKIVKN